MTFFVATAAAVLLTVNTASTEGETRLERCPGHRHGLLWYRDRTWAAQDARGASRTRYGGAARSPSCAYVQWAAGLWRGRARAEQKRLEQWRRSQVVGEPWYSLAVCESGRRPPAWHINTGNGFHGGLQFHPGTWAAYRRAEPMLAYLASPAQQVAVARRVQAAQGWRAWPTCSRLLGLR